MNALTRRPTATASAARQPTGSAGLGPSELQVLLHFGAVDAAIAAHHNNPDWETLYDENERAQERAAMARAVAAFHLKVGGVG